MFDTKNCPLYGKLSRGEPLSQSEKKLLTDIVRKEIKFLLRNQILPTPRNFVILLQAGKSLKTVF